MWDRDTVSWSNRRSEPRRHRLGELLSLSQEQWSALHEALTLHALYKAIGLSWAGLPRGKTVLLPGGQSPADIASEVIVRVINGDRTCNARNYPEMLKILKG